MAQPNFAKYVVLLDNFSHDTNGNPTALHTVFGYRDADADLMRASSTLYEAKRRAQIGYGNDRGQYVPDALRKAGLNTSTLELLTVIGDRSEGHIRHVYIVKGAGNANK
ncbi:hypothetical protein ACO0LM_11905 [Undibacterium sp. Di26W]|uniref:hypothetical protein n=1 Tax=Undibacterium sp. Di26W TaxID=3413035 RepID=UPI003BF41E88